MSSGNFWQERKYQDASPANEQICLIESEAAKEEDACLPSLSAAGFKVYNRIAELMDLFHNHFRQTRLLLRTACSAGKTPDGMTLRAFLQHGDMFVQQLTLHHTVEEERLFPVLATRMECFEKQLELLTQHKQIHEGLVEFEAYIQECHRGRRDFVFAELGQLMDLFANVLWEHLDQEVHQLRAENMRMFWSIDEMERMPV